MQHLVGQKLPDVELPSSAGGFVNPSHVAGWAVYFFYPYTGKAGHPDPENWDQIAGAHGSTPQALAYARDYVEFLKLDVRPFGVSLLSSQWQLDFSDLHKLPFAFLSDHAGLFSGALCLPRFETGGQEFLTRLTLIVGDGVIKAVRFPVAPPDDDARACLTLLRELK